MKKLNLESKLAIFATTLKEVFISSLPRSRKTVSLRLDEIEPVFRITSVNKGAEICKKEKIDVLLAVGGGSAIDATKFIGAGAFYDGDEWDILTGKATVTKVKH